MKIKTNLTGSKVVSLLRKGHMVRRACWVEGYLIRICNEDGFDSHGNARYSKKSSIYTIATDGFFMHIGSSSQPFNHKHYSRDGEGFQMLWESDWEDHGFISAEDFTALTDAVKARVRKSILRWIKHHD